MAEPDNPVRRCVAAYHAEVGDGEGTLAGLAREWGVSVQALYDFERKGYLPFERAKVASERWSLPLRELVKPDLRAAMDLEAGRA